MVGIDAVKTMSPVLMSVQCRSRHVARLLLLTALACLLTAPAALADEAARSDLQRMGEAMRSLSYEGVFVYMQGDRTDTMQVMHGAGEEGESRERVTALTGKPLEVIRHGDRLVCLLPDDDRAIIGQQAHGLLPRMLAEDLESVPQQYRARSGSETRVAGRRARAIELEPVDGYRHGVRIWVDYEHGLLLRSELIAADGSVLERLLFTELKVVASIDPEAFEYELDDYARIDEFVSANADADDGARPWLDPELPPGYALVALNTRPVDGDGRARQHAIFSDGLATVSLFIDEDAGAEGVPGRSDRGALRVRSRRLGAHRVTLVGAVPEATVDFLFARLERAAGSRSN